MNYIWLKAGNILSIQLLTHQVTIQPTASAPLHDAHSLSHYYQQIVKAAPRIGNLKLALILMS